MRHPRLPGAVPAQRAPTGAIRPVRKESNAVAAGGVVLPTGIRGPTASFEENVSITRSDIRHTGFRESGDTSETSGNSESSGGY